jgi:hypothetical protein
MSKKRVYFKWSLVHGLRYTKNDNLKDILRHSSTT